MSDFSPQYALKYQQLLRDLKTTVEGLLVTQVPNVWNIYGALNRLHSSVEKIFKHGSKSPGLVRETSSYLTFIQGLDWLQPENSKSYFTIDCEYDSHLPQLLKGDKASIWLYRSLENHSLSQKLSWLLSDKGHLLNCYQSYAFLCQEKYAEATLICLRAVERNQATLMSEINPCLFLSQSREIHKTHRRCSSYPEKTYCHSSAANLKSQKFNKTRIIKGKLRPWHSMPDLEVGALNESKITQTGSMSKTTPNTPVHSKKKISPSLLKVDYKSLQYPKMRSSNKPSLKKSMTNSRRKEIRHVVINSDIIEHTPPLSSSQSSGILINDELLLSSKSAPDNRAHSPRLVDSFLPLSGEKDLRRKPKKSFIEDGGMSVLPPTTSYFPKPRKGQSLSSFLTSSQFARANAALDRENAHFGISEAIISAMEQIRFNRRLKLLADEQMDDSDPEIMDLKQRIRLRRRQKLLQKQRRAWTESYLMSDGKTDTATSVSPCSTTPDSSCASSDDVDDLDIDETSNLSEDRGLSASMASLYSEADVLKRPRGVPDGASDVFSAEGVALSLISKFSDKQLPRASDLEWLVSENEVPQALLPLPDSWPVSPDDSLMEGANNSMTSLRGTQEWAPPRPQIIFTMHPTSSRKVLMAKQNFRCAGCSMKVAPQYASRFRYCDYLGRYFCTGCHTNQLAVIPGRVLQKWNFNEYPVSSFSYRLLEQMYSDPLFRVFELNKNIGKMSKNLQFCRRYRLGLYYLKDFMYSCRFADQIRELLEREKSYLLADPEVYSLEDLVHVRNGEMKKKLQYLVDVCCRHAAECKLCLARGFICEICNSDEVIFPWQMRKVASCSKCGICFHLKCWEAAKPCPKCTRISKRRESTS